MATSGTVTTGTLKHSYYYVNWQQTGQSTSGNYTSINWQAGINCGNSSGWDSWYSNAMRIDYVSINGGWVLGSTTYSNVSGKGDHQLASGSTTVGHNTDGTKTFNVSLSGWLYSYGTTTGSNDFSLTQIPRYLTSINNSIASTALNSFKINWSCSPERDWTQYTLNGGAWTDASTSGTTSGSYTISGRVPGTQYNIRTRLRRKDSQLWSEASTLYPTTKGISTIDAVSSLTLPAPGTASTITYNCTNPSGNTTYVYLERNNDGGSNYSCNSGSTNVTTGTGKTLTLSAAAVNKIYEQHPTAKSASGMQLTARTTGDEYYYHQKTVTINFSEANCGPTAIANMTIKETDTQVQTLTGMTGSYSNGANFIIMPGYSKAQCTVAANPLTVRASATNSKLTIAGGTTLNAEISNTANIDSNVTSVTITATDSRGYSKSRTSSTFTVKKYTPISITNFKIERGDGMGTDAYLTVAGTYNTTNFGAKTNAITSTKLYLKPKNLSLGEEEWLGAPAITNGVISTSTGGYIDVSSLITKSSGSMTASAKTIAANSTNLIFTLGQEYDAMLVVSDTVADTLSAVGTTSARTTVSSGSILMSAVKGEGVCFGTFYDSTVGGPLQVDKREVLGATGTTTWN